MQTPYELIGGDAKVRELVRRFYDLMDAEPGFAGIRKLHQSDLSQAREKLYLTSGGSAGRRYTSSATATRCCGPGVCRLRSALPIGICG